MGGRRALKSNEEIHCASKDTAGQATVRGVDVGEMKKMAVTAVVTGPRQLSLARQKPTTDKSERVGGDAAQCPLLCPCALISSSLWWRGRGQVSKHLPLEGWVGLQVKKQRPGGELGGSRFGSRGCTKGHSMGAGAESRGGLWHRVGVGAWCLPLPSLFLPYLRASCPRLALSLADPVPLRLSADFRVFALWTRNAKPPKNESFMFYMMFLLLLVKRCALSLCQPSSWVLCFFKVGWEPGPELKLLTLRSRSERRSRVGQLTD